MNFWKDNVVLTPEEADDEHVLLSLFSDDQSVWLKHIDTPHGICEALINILVQGVKLVSSLQCHMMYQRFFPLR